MTRDVIYEENAIPPTAEYFLHLSGSIAKFHTNQCNTNAPSSQVDWRGVHGAH